jgi:hypothetical protein
MIGRRTRERIKRQAARWFHAWFELMPTRWREGYWAAARGECVFCGDLESRFGEVEMHVIFARPEIAAIMLEAVARTREKADREIDT